MLSEQKLTDSIFSYSYECLVTLFPVPLIATYHEVQATNSRSTRDNFLFLAPATIWCLFPFEKER